MLKVANMPNFTFLASAVSQKNQNFTIFFPDVYHVASGTDVKYSLCWNRVCRNYFATIIFEMGYVVAENTSANKQVNKRFFF